MGQAQGVRLVTLHVTAAEAFDLMRELSQRRNTKLRLVAEHVVHCGGLPER